MKNKNTMFNCGENDEADLLFCMLEANSVLSESFTTKVRNIGLVIVTNLVKNELYVEDSIINLKKEMQWLNIFSREFIGILTGQLLLAFHKQKRLNNEV